MIIAATSDIHSPNYYDLFIKSINNLTTEPDLFLIGGDVIDRKTVMDTGTVKEYQKVSNVLFGKISCPIIACFGNNEFEQDWDEIKEQNPEIKFLNDQSIRMKIKEIEIGIVGTKGSIDRPTWWQRNNMPNIWTIYKERIDKVDELLKNLKVDFKILLTHYPPTYKILEGEGVPRYPELGSNRFEKVLIERKPNLVLTGHAHRGKKQVWVDTVPIFNTALMLNEKIVVIDTDKLKPGLEKFF